MRALMLIASIALTASIAGCAPPGSDLSGAVASAVSVARSGVDATANAFDAALYGLDFAMDTHLLAPGSNQAKQIAVIGREVQAALNTADAAVKAGNSAGAKAAIDQANALISQFKTLLPAKSTTGLVDPPRTPLERMRILERASA